MGPTGFGAGDGLPDEFVEFGITVTGAAVRGPELLLLGDGGLVDPFPRDGLVG